MIVIVHTNFFIQTVLVYSQSATSIDKSTRFGAKFERDPNPRAKVRYEIVADVLFYSHLHMPVQNLAISITNEDEQDGLHSTKLME